MATSGQFYWPSVGSSVAAYGQFVMAANTVLAPHRTAPSKVCCCPGRRRWNGAMEDTSILATALDAVGPQLKRLRSQRGPR